jgi:hypothetical protein
MEMRKVMTILKVRLKTFYFDLCLTGTSLVLLIMRGKSRKHYTVSFKMRGYLPHGRGVLLHTGV